MPSQDEQMIWEELHHFPDQFLSWERKQAILENIREERRKIQKREKRKKYFWAANALITCAVLFACIWIKPFSVPVETSGSPLVLSDQAYFTAAQKAIASLGIDKTFQFKEVWKEKDYFSASTRSEFEMVNEWAIVSFTPNTTEVRSVAVKCAIAQFPSDYQKYVNTAQNAFKQANNPVHFQYAHLFKDKVEATLYFRLDNYQFVDVNLQTNKVTGYSIDYKPDDVDKKYVSIAKKALAIVSNKPNYSFTKANKTARNNVEIWTLSNEPEKYAVQIGAKTGRLYSLSYRMDRYKIKTIDEAIPVTKPLIKSIFGLDITGYKAYGGRSWGGYVLKSPGKPNVVVQIYDLDIGDISRIDVEWEK